MVSKISDIWSTRDTKSRKQIVFDIVHLKLAYSSLYRNKKYCWWHQKCVAKQCWRRFSKRLLPETAWNKLKTGLSGVYWKKSYEYEIRSSRIQQWISRYGLMMWRYSLWLVSCTMQVLEIKSSNKYYDPYDDIFETPPYAWTILS